MFLFSKYGVTVSQTVTSGWSFSISHQAAYPIPLLCAFGETKSSSRSPLQPSTLMTTPPTGFPSDTMRYASPLAIASSIGRIAFIIAFWPQKRNDCSEGPATQRISRLSVQRISRLSINSRNLRFISVFCPIVFPVEQRTDHPL